MSVQVGSTASREVRNGHGVSNGHEPATGVHRVRVLLADDDGGYRRELVHAIQANLELELIGEACNGQSALDLIERLEPDVAVVDLRMPGMNGFELCTRLLATSCRTRVVVLTAYVDGALVRCARRAGAAGYLGKETSMWDICEAVSRVSDGGTAFARA